MCRLNIGTGQLYKLSRKHCNFLFSLVTGNRSLGQVNLSQAIAFLFTVGVSDINSM